MKIFLKYIGFVLLGVIIIDLVNRCIFEYAYNKAPHNSELAARFKYQFYSDSIDVLIMGASRAEFHYNSKIIEDSTGLLVYNSGLDGMGIYSHYISLKKALKNSDIKYVIWEYSNRYFDYDWNQERISRFYPYYWENNDVKDVVNDVKGKMTPFLMLSSLYQYNSQLYNLYLAFFKKSNNYHGYIKLSDNGRTLNKNSFNSKENMNDKPFYPNDSLNIKYFYRIIDLCKNNNIQLIICNSPSLAKTSEKQDLFIKNICKKQHVFYWDYKNSKYFQQNTNLFRDIIHLNYKGADEYSKIIGHNIKQLEKGYFLDYIYEKE